MDQLTKKFDSSETLMMQAIDKLSGLETWRTSAESATDKLLSQTERLATQLQRLETATPQPPPALVPRPATTPLQPPSRWTNPFDLNIAPPPATRPYASSGERPSGHHVDNHHWDVGSGILGSHPPHPVPSMPPDLELFSSASLDSAAGHTSRAAYL